MRKKPCRAYRPLHMPTGHTDEPIRMPQVGPQEINIINIVVNQLGDNQTGFFRGIRDKYGAKIDNGRCSGCVRAAQTLQIGAKWFATPPNASNGDSFGATGPMGG